MHTLIASRLRQISKGLTSAGQARMDKYVPHPKKKLDEDLLKKIHEGLLLEYDDIKFYKVKGDVVRNEFIDEDFCSGGNFSRYRYVPEGEIWVESVKDLAPIAVHEYVECRKMKDHGWHYNRAHEYATKMEKKYREEYQGDAQNFETVPKFLDRLKY